MPGIHSLPVNKDDKEGKDTNTLVCIAITLLTLGITLALWGILR